MIIYESPEEYGLCVTETDDGRYYIHYSSEQIQPTRDELIAMAKAVLSHFAPAVPAHVHERWNIEPDGDDLLVCFNLHEKGEKCDYVRYVPAPAVPEGWKLVPIEPTEAMLDAAEGHLPLLEGSLTKAYKAMLNAAPEVLK